MGRRTDVFEAMKAVERNYPVDRRVLLRGFSMGGAGTWHLGLHHPREWCSGGRRGLFRIKKLCQIERPVDCQDKVLHIYDAEDYALNAFNVPSAGYGGEQDAQLQASENILKALIGLGFEMEQDGLVTRAKSIDFIRVIGAKMGHKIDPASAEILKEFRDKHAEKGQHLRPDSVRFITYTLAYNQAPWLQVEAVKTHYDKTLVEATSRTTSSSSPKPITSPPRDQPRHRRHRPLRRRRVSPPSRRRRPPTQRHLPGSKTAGTCWITTSRVPSSSTPIARAPGFSRPH